MKFRLLLIALLFLFGAGVWLMPSQAKQSDKGEGGPYYSQAVAFAVSPEVRNLPTPRPDLDKQGNPVHAPDREAGEKNVEMVRSVIKELTEKPDPVMQTREPNLPSVIPGPTVSFDGVNNADNQTAFGFRLSPPDTEGDVGPNDYVQGVNLLVRIYDKAGVPRGPAFKQSALFAALGGVCSTTDDGDPIVLYDRAADRWLISQFALPNFPGPPYHECIAISKNGDPTGSYYLYDFVVSGNNLPDYPHLGVWPDAYYMSSNQFLNGASFNDGGAFAFDRTKMLAGDPTAGQIYFDMSLRFPGQFVAGMLPSDYDGLTSPTVGAPNVFAYFIADEFGDPSDGLRLFNFHADFAIPANSTFNERPESPLAVAAFNPLAPGLIAGNRRDIPQPPPAVVPTNNLQGLVDRLMHRLQYVNFGGFESLVVNHTVDVDPTAAYVGGVRYYQLRRTNPATTYAVSEQSTFSPDTNNRFMGSAAVDNQGNLAVGYSVSSTTVMPSIRYAGRAFNDPPGGLFQGETVLINGTGVQLSTQNRWGDYSALQVDPTDDCSFWYTNEYYTAASQASSVVGWLTRVGKFKFASCTAPAQGTLSGTITNCQGGAPIQNAIVTVSGGPSAGFSRATLANGTYTMNLAPGTYTVTITAPNFATVVINNVIITDGATTTINQCLVGVPVIVSAGATLVSESCTPANGAIDPGETVTVSFCVQNTGGANTTNLVGTLQATGGVTSPSGPQNYGVVVAGGPAVCRNFTFTASGTCGGTLTASIQFQDGAINLGTVTYTFTLGAAGAPITRSFTFSPGVFIPDSTPAGVNIPFNVAGVGNIADLNFRIDGTSCNTTNPSLTVGVDHSWVGDLTFKLTSPAATTVTIIERPGAGTLGSSGNNFCQTLLDDDGAFPGIDTILSTGSPPLGPPYTGTFLPQNPLSAFDGQSADGNWNLNVSDNAGGDTGFVRAFSLIFQPLVCCVGTGGCTITCPPPQTAATGPGATLCCAVVNYPAPTTTGTCGTVTCSPPAGTCFPVGTTTVTCTATAGPSCSFTVVVVDNTPPTITCPQDITAVGNPGDFCVPVNFTVTASDNCAGVTIQCVNNANPSQIITSGFCFPLVPHCTTVKCTATDASANTAVCTFNVCVFDVCMEDDADPTKVLLFDSFTGDYIFCCGSFSLSGTGTVKKKGGTWSLTHTPPDRRVQVTLDTLQHRGSANLQFPVGTQVCSIQDRDTRNNSCQCAVNGGMGPSPKKK
jgi:subtilisin-like proprotein convertase family protein